MFLFKGDRDLGVAFQTHLVSQALSRGEANTPFSSRVTTGISWIPLSGLKEVKPPLQFGERTRDCSPGQAGKEVHYLSMTAASRVFSRAMTQVWCFPHGTTGSSGSLLCGAREVRSPCAWLGGVRHCSLVMIGDSDLKTH